jgi:DNA-binding CsgD family transcriptional regulator/tetratricopeptide (TPR) repeat protein
MAPLDPLIRRSAMIERSADLEALQTLVQRAKQGQGNCILVSGEAGIGKSRLIAEAKTFAATQGLLLFQGTCFPTDQSSPYAPLLDLVRSTASRPFAAAAASELAPFARELHPLFPDLAPLPAEQPKHAPPAPEPEKLRLFTALAQFFLLQAERQPVLVVIEDLHWSDETSLEWLHYLTRRCFDHALLLLLTYRSEEVHPGLRHFLAQLDRERLAQERTLARLTRQGVAAMLQAMFTLPQPVRLDLLDSIYALTEGNPFFVEEILTALIASGGLFSANGRWQFKLLEEVQIPRSIQDAVQQRTTRLSQNARRVLTLAAVAGRRFDVDLLLHLTGEDELGMLQALKELLAAQLVVEESAEQFAFRHALTRQVIYADLLLRERKALHRTIAETIEHLSASHRDAHLADLAYHYYQAGAWEKAVDYGQRAGEQAQRLYAPQAAIEHLTHTLDAAQYGDITPDATLYRQRGQAYEALGDFEQARLDYETTLQMTRMAADRRGEWQALNDLGFLWAERDYSQAGSYYQQALDLARQMDDPLTLAHSLNRLGNWQVNSEQPGDALRSHQEALALFEQAQDQQGLAETYDLLGMTSTLGGDLLHAATSYYQAIELFQQLDNRQGLASSLSTLMVLGEGGGYEVETMAPAATSFAKSLTFGERALTIAREIGQRSAEAYALLALAQYLGPHGEYARALEVAQAGLALAEQIEHRQWVTAAHWQVGVLYLDLLAVPEAERHLTQALALAQEIGSGNWIRIVSGFLARTCILQREVARAEQLLDAALPPDAPSQTIGQRLVWRARAELALARGSPSLALELTNRLIASAANLSEGQVIPHLWKLQGEALAALQQESEAEAALRAALASARAQRLRPLHWRVAAALGSLFRTTRRSEDAEQASAAARVTIEELAAEIPEEVLRTTFLSNALAGLSRPRPLTPRRVTRQAFGGLTEREREVAALIAQGASNKEIAAHLVVGLRTVETHVSSIFSKLGLTSRAQIAVWANEKGLAQTAR